ncbi:hypothetical protein Nepgr_002536 [Nepenthes gracilis]|uniref:Uncharacterized protein n=1 Tax=Nepenthes gracilis TaxID=150966 RepID=A0AAD3PA31_NEPGR|nr:hypothetical protein Nepgr_002536 [Nepenthes gracilis]
MNETTTKKKVFISEEDISTLLHRYTATTVLSLLQEVALSSGVKIDWDSLVKKTATGISNAREYQMLWRHLAYRHFLVEKLEDGAGPLDDDSDLEYELEAFPSVSTKSSMEDAACVKVLIASGLPSESSILKNSTVSLKAPEIPLPASSNQCTNITVPVSVQKLPLPAGTSGDGMETNRSASGGHFSRRKRKPWSVEEDLELIAAVRKCGEGNWATILKGDFKGDRTASQLSQRWGTIRKKQGSLNIGANLSRSLLSEAQLATRQAINMALKDTLTSACAGNGAAGTSSLIRNSSMEDSLVVNNISLSQQRSYHQVVKPTSSRTTLVIPVKSRPPPKKIVTKPTTSPDSMVQATTVAAGACIASPSEAGSLFHAAQTNNAVDVMPVDGGGSLINSLVTGNGNLLTSTHLPGLPNVHYFRTGVAAATPSPMAAGSHQMRSNVVRSTVLSESAKVATTPTSVISPEQTTATCSLAIELQGRQDKKTAEAMKTPNSNTETSLDTQDGPAAVSGHASGEQLEKDQSMLLLPKVEEFVNN